MPHGWNGQFGAALIGRHRFVGHEVEDAAAVGETALLDLMLAHTLLAVGEATTADARPAGEEMYSRARGYPLSPILYPLSYCILLRHIPPRPLHDELELVRTQERIVA